MFTDSCNSHMMLIASIQYLQLFFFLVSSYQLIQRKKDPNWETHNGFVHYISRLNKVKLQVKLHGGPDTKTRLQKIP